MEESNYKHNYEYLSIEEAKTIVNGTFVQGTTNIGGELATKDDIDHLVDNANKRLTSIVPVTDTSNEFICFFECEDIETFPDEWTYVFHYDVSGTSGSSSTPTSWTKQYNVDGQQINNNLVLNGITSYKIKTGSLGTVQRENVSYSGQVGSPSGYNYSEQEATGSGHLTQNGSGKQLQWSYTQNANVKVWNISADKTSLSFPANGGTRSVQITTWYTWQYNNNNNQKFDQNTTTENITAEANTLQQQKTWTKVITKNNKSVSIQCTQEGAQEQFPDDLQHRWIRVQPESSQISVDGGTINVTGSYGLTGTFGTERKVGDITDTIVVESNSTQGQKSGSKTYYYNNNQSDTPTAKITWTQPGRAEEFPDDEAHRWIEITPTNAGNFTEAGGTITVTGSYGLTGSYGTKRTVGQINDTITVEKNTTTQTKSGSKTYYYNNTPGTNPSATVTWTQDARSVIAPTSVHVTNIILYVGQNQQIQYEVTPSNADVDTCTYEVISGSEYVHITDGVVYADAVGKAVYKITINGTVESTFHVSVINDNAEKLSGDVFIIQAPGGDSNEIIDFHSPEYCKNPKGSYPEYHNYIVYHRCFISGIDHGAFHTGQNIIIDVDKIRETYKQIKNKPSLIKGKTIEQACQIHGGHYIYIYLYSDSFWKDAIGTINTLKCRGYKKSSNSSISFVKGSNWCKLNGYTPTGDVKNINYLTYGTNIDYISYMDIDNRPVYDDGYNNNIVSDYFSRCGTLFAYIMIDLDSNSETSVFNFVSSNNGYIEKGYHVTSKYSNKDIIKEMVVDYTQNSLDTTGDYMKLNITINKINNSTDISNLRGNMVAWCFKDKYSEAKEAFYGTDSNGAFFDITDQKTLPYTTQINIPKKNFNKVQLYLSALNTNDSLIYRSAPIEITL